MSSFYYTTFLWSCTAENDIEQPENAQLFQECVDMNEMLQKVKKNIANILIFSGVMRYNRSI